VLATCLQFAFECGELTHTKRDISPSKDWPAGIARLLDEARTDVEQLLSHGRIDRAAELTQAPGMFFKDTYNPMYFTGAFESPIVLIHLNPKLSPELADYPYSDFNDFYVRHRHFGALHWGLDPSYFSRFDLKQVRFLRPFKVINFEAEPEVGYSRVNAAMACDLKLQLELIPYASQKFETSKFSMAVLEPHFARVLAAISAYPRKYVLFCGAVFDDLIEKSGLLNISRRPSISPTDEEWSGESLVQVFKRDFLTQRRRCPSRRCEIVRNPRNPHECVRLHVQQTVWS